MKVGVVLPIDQQDGTDAPPSYGEIRAVASDWKVNVSRGVFSVVVPDAFSLAEDAEVDA